ncbi:hypothetical protein TNCV_2641331 [Trichonephila clavipes]|nr:hypothetical protein TNCV_2641331 [Trichonephila clavipes]
MQVTVDFAPFFHPSFEREHPGDGQRPPPLFPSTNLTRGLADRRLFRLPPCREGTIHLQTSVPSARFEPRAAVAQWTRYRIMIAMS